MIKVSKIEIRPHPKFYGVYISGPSNNIRLYSKNLVPGHQVYGERIIEYKNEEFREWDPYRSKLAALIIENPTSNFISNNTICLYLGASSGTTISHLSDIIKNGVIYGIEFAERSIRQLIQNTTNRKNIIPILADARYPDTYTKSIFNEIELIYQDVAQPNQAEIAVLNANYYLKSGGLVILAIKSQSIDSISKSEKIYKQEKNTLENAGYEIVESINIHKYAANHIILIVKKK
ncbi:MAG: fibrillarin-like rRNA/tRNA 2'-O-methyltransferase [Promethearchaeota archaeon]|nr:MAG: fibrillarin-like rRNA/tRNA 2'-O-methyltransferase [Candidatus Lokiarchaeota archaeon]